MRALVLGFGESDLIHGGNESYAVGDGRIIADFELSEIKNSLNSCEKKSLVSEKKDSKKESSANEVKYKICPVCGCKLRFNNFRKHMALQHDIKVDSTVLIESKETLNKSQNPR